MLKNLGTPPANTLYVTMRSSQSEGDANAQPEKGIGLTRWESEIENHLVDSFQRWFTLQVEDSARNLENIWPLSQLAIRICRQGWKFAVPFR